MKNTKIIVTQESEVERLLDAIESVPTEKIPIMAVLAEAFINGMKAQDKIVTANRTTIISK